MAECKIKAHVVLFILFSLFSFGAGLEFHVDVSGVPEVNLYDPELVNSSNPYFFRADVENSGSTGCEYFLKSKIEYGKDKSVSYSEPGKLFPGKSESLKVFLTPYNYTGMVETSISVSYCGKTREISEFSFNQTDRIFSNRSMETKVLESNSSGAVLKTKKDVLMAPHDTPDLWKAGFSETVNSSEAYIHYNPPLFQEDRSLEYLVFDRKTGDFLGKTSFTLKPERTFFRHIKDNPWKAGLIVSSLFNLLLFLYVCRSRWKD